MAKLRNIGLVGFLLVMVIAGRTFWLSHGAFAALVVEQFATDSPSNNDKWKEFKTEQFKVLLPTYPERFEISNSYNEIVYMYMSRQSNGNFYMVTITTAPDLVDVSRPDTILEGVLKGMLSKIDGSKLIYSKPGSFRKWHSLDFLIHSLLQVKASGHTISINRYDKGRIILAGHVLYALAENYKGANCNENEYNRFVNSLDFQGLH